MAKIKRFVIGDYDTIDGTYALVFAKTKEEAIEKVKSIKVGDEIDCYDKNKHVVTEDDLNMFKDNPIDFNKIIELKSDVFILTNDE